MSDLPSHVRLAVYSTIARSRALHYAAEQWVSYEDREVMLLCSGDYPTQPADDQRRNLPLCKRCQRHAKRPWGVTGDPLREVARP